MGAGAPWGLNYLQGENPQQGQYAQPDAGINLFPHSGHCMVFPYWLDVFVLRRERAIPVLFVLLS